MSSDAGEGPADGQPRGRPAWVWVLVAVCAAVGVGLVVAVAGLFTSTAPQPAGPGPGTATESPSVPDGGLDAYRLSDALPLTAAPVWHAAPGAHYRLTAAPDEFRYVAANGCTMAFRTGPLVPSPPPSQRTTAAGSPSVTASPPASVPAAEGSAPGSAGSAPSDDPETAATRAALEGAVQTAIARGVRGAVTGRDFTVVTTLGSLTGPLVDMAGATVRVEHADGTVTHVRLAVRAVPRAQASFQVATECPTPEESATAMNHASVHAYVAQQ